MSCQFMCNPQKVMHAGKCGCLNITIQAFLCCLNFQEASPDRVQQESHWTLNEDWLVAKNRNTWSQHHPTWDVCSVWLMETHPEKSQIKHHYPSGKYCEISSPHHTHPHVQGENKQWSTLPSEPWPTLNQPSAAACSDFTVCLATPRRRVDE